MWTRTFVRDTLERAGKTFVQVFAAMLAACHSGLVDTDWQRALSVAGMAAVLSLLSSVGSNVIAPDATASLVGAVVRRER